MTHYICTGGCEGVSETPGTCQSKDCAKSEQPLDSCDCTEELHGQPKEETV